MIKPNELRIGNIVEHENIIWQVEKIESKKVDISNGSNYWDSILTRTINPIPLTKEWLVRFGFEETSTHWVLKEGYNDGLEILYNLNESFYIGIGMKRYWVNSVHQLQNIYFSLTNKELKLI